MSFRRTAIALLAATVVAGIGLAGGLPQASAAPAGTRTTAHAVAARATGHAPAPAPAWVAAWNGTDPQQLARLFTADATYTDLGVNKTSHGRAGIAGWKTLTDQLIADVHITLVESFRSGDHVAIETLYSGHVKGAPKPFAVPGATVLTLRGEKIVDDKDYYNLAALLAQSGLPADWTPGS